MSTDDIRTPPQPAQTDQATQEAEASAARLQTYREAAAKIHPANPAHAEELAQIMMQRAAEASAARLQTYREAAAKLHPTNPAAAEELVQSMQAMAARGGGRRREQSECPSNYGGTGCRRPVCRCYPDRGYDRGGRGRTLSR